MESRDVPEVRMRWLLLVPTAAVELPSLVGGAGLAMFVVDTGRFQHPIAELFRR